MPLGQTRHDDLDRRISDMLFRAISKFPRELRRPAEDFLCEHRAAYIFVQEMQHEADLLRRPETSVLFGEESN
jgi:hypothetical protein